MTIKTATRIAIIGISLTLLVGLLRPFLLGRLLQGMTNQQYSIFLNLAIISQDILGWGSLLIFLVVLSSKQKGQV